MAVNVVNDDPSLPLPLIGMVDRTTPATALAAPYAPSSIECKFFHYGLPSQPRSVARFSLDVWLEPTGPEAYLLPKESSPIGLHPLREIWEATVGPDMILYLDSKAVEWTSLDPVRMRYASDSARPVIVWIGVVPGSLTAEKGFEVATQCRSILSAYNINTHVEIRESVVMRSAGPKMYRPDPSFSFIQAQEPFSTALGLPICAEATPSFEGTGGFYVSDPSNPGKIYLVTARHVVLHPEKEPNMLYRHSSQRRNVLIFWDAAIETHSTAIEFEIDVNLEILRVLGYRLENAKQRKDVEEERNLIFQVEGAKRKMESLEELRTDVFENWKSRENRILGYVLRSQAPPIGLGVGEEEFTEDWSVIEIDSSKVDSTNFVGNAIDLDNAIPLGELLAWMCPSNPPFEYPGDGVLRPSGTIPDREMWKPSAAALDHNHDSCIMVIKRSYGSGLTVGRLNTIRSFTRFYSKNKPSQMSKEVAFLPRNSNSGAFSIVGGSGSAVVDGKGRLAGLLTGGAGATEVSDCTYVTSINFIHKRMLKYGFKADLDLPWGSCFGIVIIIGFH